jgi:hypothetical protein
MKKNYLDLSTAHLSYNTTKTLEDKNNSNLSDFPLRFFTHEYGYTFFVYDIFECEDYGDEFIKEIEKHNMPELAQIIKYAVKKKCEIINFDQDAEKIKELKTFEW